jgi:hypothetical protein
MPFGEVTLSKGIEPYGAVGRYKAPLSGKRLRFNGILARHRGYLNFYANPYRSGPRSLRATGNQTLLIPSGRGDRSGQGKMP